MSTHVDIVVDSSADNTVACAVAEPLCAGDAYLSSAAAAILLEDVVTLLLDGVAVFMSGLN